MAFFRLPQFFRRLGREQMSRIPRYREGLLVHAIGTCNVVVSPRLRQRRKPGKKRMHREFSCRLDKGFDRVFATSKAFGVCFNPLMKRRTVLYILVFFV